MSRDQAVFWGVVLLAAPIVIADLVTGIAAWVLS